MQLQTFQQWQAALRDVREGAAAPEILRQQAPAGLRFSPAAEQALREEVEKTVNTLLKKAGDRFSRGLREASEQGGLEEILLLARRFRREVRSVLFIRELSFLGADYRRELEAAVRRELDRNWRSLLGGFRRQAAQTPSPQLEELILSLRNFRLMDEV